ncbi:MAG TPA: DUF4126 domain-containing protein [Smithella sp.]|nr:DUF4126 domain-containing protein [Smithella sp.]
MDTAIGIAVGVGLSAACGFRVFVPLLIMNLAAGAGMLQLPAGFAWLASSHATIAFATATVLEVLAYYIPGIDHLLDIIATPAAVVAGTITTASMAVDLSPFLKWTLALMAGGGMAGLVQGTTVAVRAKSAAATGGMGNPVVATLELAAAMGVALTAIFVPVMAIIGVVLLLIFFFKKLLRLVRGKTEPA